jgi:chromosome segregation protein
LREKFTSSKNDLEETSSKIGLLQQEKKSFEIDLVSFIKRRDSLDEQWTAKKEKNASLVETVKTLEISIKKTTDELNQKKRSLSEKTLERLYQTQSLDSLILQVREKFMIDPDPIDECVRDISNVKNFAKEIQAIKAELDSFGPINMMAIKEHDELAVRENFIVRHQEEILSSIFILQQAIEEIDESSRAKFLSIFEILNREFQQLFPILFPYGEASLHLLDPDTPLESGIEIMVRLPGKMRQNMRLFSGGEKALTAIALIFALLKSKPTPFCFLDEVDAPLDETNVVRYNNVLQALSSKFQFIVITHRRRTMEVLDTLYGVTMQEPGVSKIVGVDLTKDLPFQLKKAFQEPSFSQIN